MGTLNILLVEEDPAVERLLHCFTGQKEGWRLKSVSCYSRVFSEWEAGSYDVIVMSLQPPVMDGFQTTCRIRQAENRRGRRPIPIIAFTALSDGRMSRRCAEAGIDGILAKPTRMQDFFATIEKYACR